MDEAATLRNMDTSLGSATGERIDRLRKLHAEPRRTAARMVQSLVSGGIVLR
ncbi:hypothetical protein D3C78_1545130 [compost metagenome]